MRQRAVIGGGNGYRRRIVRNCESAGVANPWRWFDSMQAGCDRPLQQLWDDEVCRNALDGFR